MIFYVKYEYKYGSDTYHKVYCIFGIKFKFKSKLPKEKIFIENEIYINEKRLYNNKSCPNIIFNIQGKNNIVRLHSFFGKGTLTVKITNTNNCYIEFGENNHINHNLTITAVNQPAQKANGKCIIGNNNIFNGKVNVIMPLNHTVRIGSYNLFASNVEIVGCSEHMVYDVNSKEKYNIETGVTIGDKNWLGRDVLFLNKGKICNNSVVGTRSIITKEFFQSNILLAGAPAKIKKNNISWHQYLDDSYLYTNNPLEQINVH